MRTLDYSRCFVFYTGAINDEEINTCQCQILAKCEITQEATGESEAFFLGKECIGEYTYDERGIAQLPTAEVCIIFSNGKYKLLKKFVNHENDIIQIGEPEEKQRIFDGRYVYWTDLRFDLRMAKARPLESREDIIKATLDSEPMLGRTIIWDGEREWTAVLEYPIVYMNVHPPISGFQIDVGPVLFPDFASTGETLISRLELAYVMYNDFDNAEFAIRTPTQVAQHDEDQTLHYSRAIKMPASNELFRLVA